MRRFQNRFTLLELLIAMGLMVLLMLAVISIFATAMDIFNKSKAKMEVYQNARTAIDILERDLLGMFNYSSGIQEFVLTVDANSRPIIPPFPPTPTDPPFLAFAANSTYISTAGGTTRRLFGPIYIEYLVEGSSLPQNFPFYELRRRVKKVTMPRDVISEEAIAQFILPLDTSGGIPGTSGQPNLKVEVITALTPTGAVEPTYISGGTVIPWHNTATPTESFLPRGLRITMDMIDPQNRECRTISSTFWIPASILQQ